MPGSHSSVPCVPRCRIACASNSRAPRSSIERDVRRRRAAWRHRGSSRGDQFCIGVAGGLQRDQDVAEAEHLAGRRVAEGMRRARRRPVVPWRSRRIGEKGQDHARGSRTCRARPRSRARATCPRLPDSPTGRSRCAGPSRRALAQPDPARGPVRDRVGATGDGGEAAPLRGLRFAAEQRCREPPVELGQHHHHGEVGGGEAACRGCARRPRRSPVSVSCSTGQPAESSGEVAVGSARREAGRVQHDVG